MKHAWAASCGLGCLAASTLAACGGASTAAPSSWPQPAEGNAAVPRVATAPPLPIAEQPDVDLRDPRVAIVHGQPVPFDGIDEGLTWPALTKALGPRKPGEVVTVQVARKVPMEDLLRAAWTVHAADVRLQSPDASGVVRAVTLRAKVEGALPVAGCHLAVFLRADGTLRVAAPGGPREVGGEHAAEAFAHSVAEESRKCPIKYVAFGADSDGAPWGPVFDVVLAVDRDKSAGDARYVLGQAMHAR